MKKLLATFVTAMMAICTLFGCSAPKAEKNLEGSAVELLEQVNVLAYGENYHENEEMIPLFVVDLNEICGGDADMMKSYIGLSDPSIVKEAAVSETYFGQAYSVVLVRFNDGVDAKAQAKIMDENIDRRKWICMSADDSCVVSFGDVVFFAMVNTEFGEPFTSANLEKAFNTLCK